MIDNQQSTIDNLTPHVGRFYGSSGIVVERQGFHINKDFLPSISRKNPLKWLSENMLNVNKKLMELHKDRALCMCPQEVCIRLNRNDGKNKVEKKSPLKNMEFKT